MNKTGGTNSTKEPTCNVADNSTFFTSLCVKGLAILSLCKLVHSYTSRYGQPRIISEFIVGVIIGNVPFVANKMVEGNMESVFRVMEGFCSSLYMFVLGLEMEPVALFRAPGPEPIIAFAGICMTFGTFVLIGTVAKIFGLGRARPISINEIRVMIAFVIMFSAASSPIITRLVTELKLGQSDIGRRAIRAGLANDLICMACMAFVVSLRDGIPDLLGVMVFVAAEAVFVAFAGRYLFKWVNSRNPDGRNLRGLDMSIVIVLTQLMCYSATFSSFDLKMNSFLVGVLLPRKGRVSNFLIGKINYYLTTFILPLYLPLCGITFRSGSRHGSVKWVRMFVLSFVTFLTKLLGTLLMSRYYGFHWLEAFTLGIFLNMKGHFQIFFTTHAKHRGLMDQSGFLVMVIIVMSSIFYVPFAATRIIRKVRKIKGLKPRFMGVQWYNPASELRLTIGLPGPLYVASSMTLVEMMRAGSNVGTVVYAMDMIELSAENKAALVYRQGTDSVMVADNEVIELREEIKSALDSHVAANGGGEDVTMNRIVAMSSFADMHDDICCSAQDTLAILVVLPFHKSQKPDGKLDEGHPGFKTVNENVMLHAPCSVGILVDRGLGEHAGNLLTPEAKMNVVVLFIGGADDREALACAGIIAEHPSIKLLALRIIPDKDAIAVEGPGRRILAAMPQREREMKVDDEYFAGFYEHYITSGRVAYMEKHMRNGAETVRMLRGLEEEYQLFIVGQGSERNSILTAGLSEWAECPELGPIGDILADADFPSPTSVLVIKQHDPTKNSRYITDEFMPL